MGRAPEGTCVSPPQALEKEAVGCEAHTVAAGLEAAGARGQAQRLELEVERLRATNDVLAMQVECVGWVSGGRGHPCRACREAGLPCRPMA